MSQGLRDMMRGSPLMREIVKELAGMLREELQAANQCDDWIDQRMRTPLGRNTHCRAVKERLEQNPDDPHARIIGDRYLLSTVGLSEELHRRGKRPLAKTASPDDPDMAGAERVRRLLGGH